MNLTLSQISPYLLHHFASEAQLVQAVQEISHNFTKNRELIDKYLQDERPVAAYAAFYLLTNIPKLDAVMNWLPAEWVELLKDCDFVDLGAGPGTFSFAWKNLGARGNFLQIEKSPLMRLQAKKLWEGFYDTPLEQGEDWMRNAKNKDAKDARDRFVLFGHSANEMSLGTVLRYIDHIEPEHLLFIEPGTAAFFEKMLLLRNEVLGRNYHLLFPCPKSSSCPMENTKDWCHQFIEVKQDPEVERISQMAKIDRKLLPLTVMAFSRSYGRKNPLERIVRVLPETKFSFEWEVCVDNHVIPYQILKRDLTREEIKKISELKAGEAVMTEVMKKFENKQRVRLLKIIK